MIWLVAGLVLWVAAHVFKRAAPGQRAALQARFGGAAKGLFAAAILAGVVLMVIGYRSAEAGLLYVPPAWGVHLNNLLMLVAVALYGVGNSQSRLRARLRHPMLTGTLLWAAGHLLVRGDVASVVLFGGLGLWAVAAMALINMREPRPTPWQGGSLAGDIRLLVIAAVLYSAIVALHGWLGPWPLPGGRWW